MILFIKYRTAFYLTFLVAGILAGTFLTPDLLTSVLIILLLFTSVIRYPSLYFILFLPLGFLLTPVYSPDPEIERYAGEKISAAGTLIKNPELREKSTRLFIRLNKIITDSTEINVNSKIVAYLENNGHSLTYGNTVKINGIKLERIKNFKNPGGFNIEQFYKKNNIFYSAYIKNSSIQVTGRDRDTNPFLYRINLLRTDFSGFVRTNIPYPESAVINALTVGYKGNIPAHIRETFSGLGIAHIFAISGLHVGAIAVGFYFLFKWLLKRSEYILLSFQMPKIAALLTIFPVFVYTALAGFSISSVRAFIMASIFLLSIILGRDDNKLNTLFIAALVILISSPNSLFDLSFQLSFLSVFGILMIHSFYPLEISTGFDKFKTAAKTTIAATLITLPLTVNTFGYLPLFSIPSNLALIPLVELLIVPLGLVSLITFKIYSPLSLFLLSIDSYLISLVLRATDFIDSIGLAKIISSRINLETTISAAVAISIIMIGKKYRKFYYLMPPVLALSLLLAINNFYFIKGEIPEINIFDAGRKSISLIKTPGSKTILINGGYSPRSESDFIERSVVVPYLLSKNIREIDHLVLTSLDKSHLNGTHALLKKIGVKNLWINGHKLKSNLWEEIYDKKIKLHKIPEQNSSVEIDGMVFKFLRPAGLFVYDSRKPLPLLLEIIYDSFTFHTGEDTESGVFKNRKSDLIYINENKKTDFDSIIKKYDPVKVICRNCDSNSLPGLTDIYNTEQGGMVTVLINNKKINVREYIEK